MNFYFSKGEALEVSGVRKESLGMKTMSSERGVRMKRKEEPDNGATEEYSIKSFESDGEKDLKVGIETSFLDCPICFVPFTANNSQCQNGHLLCMGCADSLKHRCPTCQFPLSKVRCLLLESIIESSRISCMYAPYGCQESLVYFKKDAHEKECPYALCHCPIPACRFKGCAQLMSSHLQSAHRAVPQLSFYYGRTFKVALHKEQSCYVLREITEKNDQVFLLISRRGPAGDGSFSGFALAVVCIRPGSPLIVGGHGSYVLSYCHENPEAAAMMHKCRFDAPVEYMKVLKEGYFPKYLMYVPNGGNGIVSVSIHKGF